jgi:hypothetical protein
LSKEETRRRVGRFQMAGADPGEVSARTGPPSLTYVDGDRLGLGVVLHHFLAHLATSQIA